MKLFNLLKKKPEKIVLPAPVPAAPVPAPAVRDPNEWANVEPTSPKFIKKEDIHDIIDAFNYISWRTSKAGADVRSVAVDELDDFIKNETIDLRHLPGLVCTDCVHLIQYGTKSDKTPFVCIRLNSLNAIDPSFTEIRKDEIRKFLKKAAIKFTQKKDDGRVGSYVLDHQFVNVGYFLGHGYFAQLFDPISSFCFNGIEDDPAYAVRKETKITLIDSIKDAIKDEANKAKSIFRHKDTIVAKHGSDWFVLWEGEHLISQKMVDEFVAKERDQRGHRMCCLEFMNKLKFVQENIERLNRGDEVSYVADVFGLEFFGI